MLMALMRERVRVRTCAAISMGMLMLHTLFFTMAGVLMLMVMM